MNITLIGMPGSGKSYIGEKLALTLGYTLVELDCITELHHKKSLQAVLDTIGEAAFLTEQAQDAITETTGRNKLVISPGGSIIYSIEAMQHLKTISSIIYLHTNKETIERRINGIPRGIVGLRDKSFEELFTERSQLCEQWADYTINAEREAEIIVTDIQQQLL
jgi:shikimate kinase